MPEDKKKSLPKKPDEKSHPDPLKRFKALKEWRKAVDKITGEDKVMGWKPEKTLDKADKELDKAGEREAKAVQEEAKAVQKEVEVKKIGDIDKPLTKEEQIAKLKAIREKNKKKKEQKKKDKKKKKIIE